MSTVTTPSAPARDVQPDAALAGPILVATTADDGADAILAAAQLAARTGQQVRVLSVVEPPPASLLRIDGQPQFVLDFEEYVDLQRQRVLAQLRRAMGDAAWPIELRLGAPADVIASAARRHRASLVVMGIGRHDATARLLGGETALRTIRRARTPVLAVPDAPVVPARVAVAAVDFSASSVIAARAALALVADGGTLHLVHVWSRDPLKHPAVVARDDAHERSLPDRFAKLQSLLPGRTRDVDIVTTTEVGRPVERLVEFARARDAHLLAAGRQGHGLFERLLVGRVTTSLVRSAPCAVLVTPEPAVGDRASLELALTGDTASERSDEWAALLDGFSRRNRGRATVLEVDDPMVGAQAQESGYSLLGATFDRHDGRIELMLGRGGDAPARAPHLTRTIEGVTSVAIHADGSGREVALRLRHGEGQTILTFLPDAA